MNSEVKVGILFFIGLGLLLWFTLFTTQCSQAKGTYAVRFNRIERLKEGDQVTYNGVKVGTVTEVVPILEEGKPKVKVTFSIFSDRQKVVLIDEHSTYRIEEGLLGGSSLEIVSSSGVPITATALNGHMGNDPSGINDVIAKVDGIIDENRQGIKEAIGSVKTDLDHFGKMSSDISSVIDENRKNINSAIANISTTAEHFTRLIDDNSGVINSAITNINLMSDQVDQMIRENRVSLKLAIDKLPGAVKDAGSAMHAIGTAVEENRKDLRTTMEEIAKAAPKVDHIASSIDTITTQIASGNGTLGKLVFDDTLHDKAVQTLDDLDQRIEEVKPVTSGFAELKFYLGVDGMADTRSGVDTYGVYMRIEPAPWKFYEGGISYRTAGNRTGVATDDPNNFNVDITALFGWRFFPDDDLQAYRLSIAAGLIETEVGGIADLQLSRDLFLELEAREKANSRATDDRRYERGEAMVRATLNYTFWQRISLRAGVDDIMGEPGLWVGLRAELLDNDLRNLTTVSSLIGH